MSVESINEPGNSVLVSDHPPSINEPPAPEKPPDPPDPTMPPRATGMAPLECTIGDAPLLLQVFGTDFTADTLIVFDDVPSVTTFVSDTELNLDLNPGAFTEARGYPVTVKLGPFTAEPAMMFTVRDMADLFTPMHAGR
jgi:hypothetical protein